MLSLKKIFFLLLIFKLFITALCLEEKKIETRDDKLKKTKLTVCLNIAKSRINKDENFFEETIDFMIKSQIADKKKMSEKLVSIMILTCFKKISEMQAQILILSKPEEVDPMTPMHKELIELEKWRELYEKNDTERIRMALDEISTSTEYLNQVEEDELIQEQDNYDDIMGKTKEKKMGIFGLNLNDISGLTKLLIGFSFLAFLVLLLFYALRIVKKPLKKKKEKKL